MRVRAAIGAWLVLSCGARTMLSEVPGDAGSDATQGIDADNVDGRVDSAGTDVETHPCSSLRVVTEIPAQPDQIAADANAVFVHYVNTVARIGMNGGVTTVTTAAAEGAFPSFAHFALEPNDVLWATTNASTSKLVRTTKDGASSSDYVTVQYGGFAYVSASTAVWTWQFNGQPALVATIVGQTITTGPFISGARSAVEYVGGLLTAGDNGVVFVDTTLHVLDSTPALDAVVADDTAYYTTATAPIGVWRLPLPEGTPSALVVDNTALASVGGLSVGGTRVFFVDAKLATVGGVAVAGGVPTYGAPIDAPWVPVGVVVAGDCAFVSAAHPTSGAGRVYAMPLP